MLCHPYFMENQGKTEVVITVAAVTPSATVFGIRAAAAVSKTEVVITRETVFHGYGRTTPFGYTYEAFGPDGRRFDNSRLDGIRAVLRFSYGRSIVTREAWKAAQ